MSTQVAVGWVPRDTFSNRLVLVRREQGLSVKEAAARCGIHYATWSTWENGRKPADLAGMLELVLRLRWRGSVVCGAVRLPG